MLAMACFVGADGPAFLEPRAELLAAGAAAGLLGTVAAFIDVFMTTARPGEALARFGEGDEDAEAPRFIAIFIAVAPEDILRFIEGELVWDREDFGAM